MNLWLRTDSTFAAVERTLVDGDILGAALMLTVPWRPMHAVALGLLGLVDLGGLRLRCLSCWLLGLAGDGGLLGRHAVW